MEIFKDDWLILPQGKGNSRTQIFFKELISRNHIAQSLFTSQGLLREGMAVALFASAGIILEREIPKSASFLDHEILSMFREIEAMANSLEPQPDSNWLEECFAFGEKCGFHWDWKHYGSKELF